MKRLMEHRDHLDGVAASILVRAKVWSHCEGCGNLIGDGGYGDPTGAYKLGNYLISQKDPLVAEFERRRDMTDTVKAVYESSHGGLAVDRSCCDCRRIDRDNM